MFVKKIRQLEELLKQIAHFSNLSKNAAWYPIDENKIATILYTGQIIVVDKRDISLAPHLILRGFWEFEYGEFFRKIINPGDVVFDIGANVGYFGLLASLENEGGAIHFFEANTELCRCMEYSSWLNGLQNRAKINNIVLSDERGKVVEFKFLLDLWGSSGINVTDGREFSIPLREAETKKMLTNTIDNYCEEISNYKCDVIKMDVEGSEEKVFKGMEKVLEVNDNVRALIEYTFGSYSLDYWSFLRNYFKKISVVQPSGELINVQSEEEARAHSHDSGFCMLYLTM